MQALSMPGAIKSDQKYHHQKTRWDPFLIRICLNRHQAELQFSANANVGSPEQLVAAPHRGHHARHARSLRFSVTNWAFFHYLCHIFKMLVTKYLEEAFKNDTAVCTIRRTRHELLRAGTRCARSRRRPPPLRQKLLKHVGIAVVHGSTISWVARIGPSGIALLFARFSA